MATEVKEKGKKSEVGVLYNGVTREFHLVGAQKVEHLLREAIRVFGIVDNQHLLSLYDDAGVELADDDRLKDAGVENHELLVLRPGVVKGG